MPAPGTFVLHSSAVPELEAGAYTVHVEQTLDAPDASVPSLDASIEVTAPRFALPPDQILSTFPPNQSTGEYSSRLAQVVLRRRTLPWERKVDDAHTPWLALVLLADAEAEFETGLPVAQCVTAGVDVSGRTDVSTGNAIVVTQRVVDQVFPTAAELPLLTHVREVDLADTELAYGDDDGWLAVVLSNRLPQPGVRYRACLVSLEGQLDVLPVATDVQDDPGAAFVYPAAMAEIGVVAELAGGGGDPVVDWTGPDLPSGLDAVQGVAQRAAAASRRIVSAQQKLQATRGFTTEDSWSTRMAHTSTKPVALASGRSFSFGFHDIPLEYIDPGAKRYTFPVLAQWTFTCEGAGSFQSLMEGLDVGLLGTLPPAPPAPGPTDKPPPPPSRPAPEVADTGHVGLDSTDRGGDATRVWYRGPLLPRPGTRDEAGADGRVPLLHASDQARRVGPDGRENLSLAVAFEIGRLLALSEPSVVAALLLWRRDGYGVGRREALFADDTVLASLDARLAGVSARAGNTLLASLGADDAARFGKLRPLVDKGLEIDAIDLPDLVSLFAAGFGLAKKDVATLMAAGVDRIAGGAAVPAFDLSTDAAALVADSGALLAGLRATHGQSIADLGEQAGLLPEDL